MRKATTKDSTSAIGKSVKDSKLRKKQEKEEKKKAKSAVKASKKEAKEREKELRRRIRLRKKGIFAEDVVTEDMDESHSSVESNYEPTEEELPRLLSQTRILRPVHLQKLYHFFPRRLRFHDLALVYSLSSDGNSRITFQQKLSKIDPTILFISMSSLCLPHPGIEDSKGNIFGGFSTAAWEAAKEPHFSGTGETFLFTLHPTPQKFKWTKANDMFQLCATDCIGYGGKPHGLWIDGTFEKGKTSTSETFDNQPLATPDEFIIQEMEVWEFQMKEFLNSSKEDSALSS